MEEEQKVVPPEQLTQDELASLSHGNVGKSGIGGQLRPLVIPIVLSIVVTFAFFSFKDPTPKVDFLASVAGINKAVDDLRGGDKAVNDGLKVLSNTVNSVQGAATGQQVSIDQIKTQIGDLNNKVNAAQTTANNINGQLQNYAPKVAVDALSGMSGKVDTAISKADTASGKVDGVVSSVSAAQKDIASLKDADATVSKQITDLKEQIADLKTKITTTAPSGGGTSTTTDLTIDTQTLAGVPMSLDLQPSLPGSVMFTFKVTNNTQKTVNQLQLVIAIQNSPALPAIAATYPRLTGGIETWQLLNSSGNMSLWTNNNMWTTGGIGATSLAPGQTKTWFMQYTLLTAATTSSGLIYFAPQVTAQNYTLN